MADARAYPEGYPPFLIHLKEIEAREANPSFSRSAPRPPVIEFAAEPTAAEVTPSRTTVPVRRPAPRMPVQGRLI